MPGKPCIITTAVAAEAQYDCGLVLLFAQTYLNGIYPVAQSFIPGDDLVFQLESGFGLLRVIAVERCDEDTIWHLMAYEELFPDVESAESALNNPASLHVRRAHMALTDRAFERTPAARLGNRMVRDDEKVAYGDWIDNDGKVADRSALLMLGLR